MDCQQDSIFLFYFAMNAHTALFFITTKIQPHIAFSNCPLSISAQKLELSRAEKYVHNFVIDVELDKKLKDSAARILGYGWRVSLDSARCDTDHFSRSQAENLVSSITGGLDWRQNYLGFYL